MTVILDLEPEVESLLAKRAQEHDCGLNEYVQKLIEKDVNRSKTFDEILAPFRQSVEKLSLIHI